MERAAGQEPLHGGGACRRARRPLQTDATTVLNDICSCHKPYFIAFLLCRGMIKPLSPKRVSA